MKRYIALFCCMMVMFSFSGCGQKTVPVCRKSAFPPLPYPFWRSPAILLQTQKTLSGCRSRQSQCRDLIEPAMEIYSWFALGSMPLSSESRTSINPLTGEEDTFQRVDSPSLLRLRGIKNLLGTFLLRRNYSAFIRRIPYL